MSGAWKIMSNFIDGDKQYIVYRQKDAIESRHTVLHSGNIEFGSNYVDDRAEAEALADKLNREEGNCCVA